MDKSGSYIKKYQEKHKKYLNEYRNKWKKNKINSLSPEEKQLEYAKRWVYKKFNFENKKLKNTISKEKYNKLKLKYSQIEIPKRINFLEHKKTEEYKKELIIKKNHKYKEKFNNLSDKFRKISYKKSNLNKKRHRVLGEYISKLKQNSNIIDAHRPKTYLFYIEFKKSQELKKKLKKEILTEIGKDPEFNFCIIKETDTSIHFRTDYVVPKDLGSSIKKYSKYEKRKKDYNQIKNYKNMYKNSGMKK